MTIEDNTIQFALPLLEMGPNCADCTGRTCCPALGAVSMIASFNADMARDDVPNLVKERVLGGVFLYGVSRIERNISNAQNDINQCLGAVSLTLDGQSEGRFYYPSFGIRSLSSSHKPVESKEELEARGFKVVMDERRSTPLYVVIDPSVDEAETIGELRKIPRGIRTAILQFREAARPDQKTSRIR